MRIVRTMCLLLLLLLGVTGARAGEEAVSASELAVAIDRAAYFLHGQVHADGSFVYRVNTDPSVTMPPKYNMLRHAGAQYALSQYYALHRDPATRRVLEKATRFLLSQVDGSVEKHDDLLAVWSQPDVTGAAGPVQAKLGGTGLGLVALLSSEQVSPGCVSVDTLQKLGRFLVFMQKPNGQFVSKYIPSQGGRSDDWESLYYPGEAALGLVMLHEKDPSVEWLRAAAQALVYLAKERAGRTQVEPDHWALLATARLLPYTDRHPDIIPRETLLAHARQICNSMLADYDRVPESNRIYVGLVGDARTTPTATRLEGLLAAMTILAPEDETLRQRIREAAQVGITFLLNAQIKEGRYKGGMPRAVRVTPSQVSGRVPSADEGATEIRIDYIQHALSAMIQYQEFVVNPDDPNFPHALVK